MTRGIVGCLFLLLGMITPYMQMGKIKFGGQSISLLGMFNPSYPFLYKLLPILGILLLVWAIYCVVKKRDLKLPGLSVAVLFTILLIISFTQRLVHPSWGVLFGYVAACLLLWDTYAPALRKQTK